MEHDDIQFEASLRKFAAELDIPLPDSSISLFQRYLDELKKWNKAINLTAIDDDREILIKHFVDSIAGAKIIDNVGEKFVLDVGAGAGFPAGGGSPRGTARGRPARAWRAPPAPCSS